MLRLVTGKAGTGKTGFITDEIKASVERGEGGIIMLIPDQYSHECEKELLKKCGDGMSRYVQVSGFKYLVPYIGAVTGGMAGEYLDDGGRLLCMALTAKNTAGQLKSFTNAERSPELQNSLLGALDEMKAACITPDELRQSSLMLDKNLANKIEDIALVLETYDAIVANGRLDPADRLVRLAQRIEETGYGRGKKIYADGFTGFTVAELKVLGALMKTGADLTVCLTLDALEGGDEMFTLTRLTAHELLAYANANGIEVDGDPKNSIDEKSAATAEIVCCATPAEECEMAALKVLRLVRERSCRYRDIAIAARGFGNYRALLESAFYKYNVPLFVTERNSIASRPLPAMIAAAYDIVLGGWNSDDIISFFGTGLAPENEDECDELTKNLSTRFILEREKPFYLKKFEKASRSAHSAHENLVALGTLMEDMKLPALFNAKGAEYPEYLQMWDLVTSMLEQFDAILGGTYMDADEFSRLIRLMLSKYDIGLIPVSLDSVSAGDFDRMRRRNIRHLIVLGASEDRLPGADEDAGVFTPDEREALAAAGLLNGLDTEGELWRESLLIYNCLSLPSDTITYSYCGTKSVVVPENLEEQSFSPAKVLDAYKEHFRRLDPEKMDNLRQRAVALRGKLSEKSVENLYGKNISISATRADKFYSCKYAYFCQYGLKAQEWKKDEFSAADYGTLMHYVLEHVIEDGGTVHEYIEKYVHEQLNDFEDKSSRYIYLFRRLEPDVEKAVADTLAEIEKSKFTPVFFEKTLNGAGRTDRIDVWENGDKKYLRVVDYKTGKKKFELSDVWYGMNMQMLMYLDSLCDGGEYVPAGVMYVPARDPFISAKTDISDAELTDKRRKEVRRTGLMLADGGVPEAWETGDEKIFSPTSEPISAAQFKKLYAHIEEKLSNMESQIRDGAIEADPYKKSESEHACRFCEYASTCGFADGEKGEKIRVLEKLKNDEIWELIEKENEGNE